MLKINALLGKFKGITNQGAVIRDAVKDVLEKEFYLKIKKEQIKLKGQTVFIKISGPAKAEIAIEEKKIIERINRSLGKETVTRIS